MQPANYEIVRDMNRAIIRIRGAYAAWARAHGVSYHELLVLYSLRDFPDCTQKTICAQYGLPKQTVHNIVSAWQRAGYLTLAPGGREKIIRLTETGRRYAARIMQPLEEAEEQSVVRTGADALRRMTDEALQYGALLRAIMADAQE